MLQKIKILDRCCLLYLSNPRPPKQPEWGEEAISWAKAGHDGVKRVFKERFGGVPVRNERLWGMLRPAPKKSWSTVGTTAEATTGAATGTVAGAAAVAGATGAGGVSVPVSSSGLAPLRGGGGGSFLLSAEEEGREVSGRLLLSPGGSGGGGRGMPQFA